MIHSWGVSLQNIGLHMHKHRFQEHPVNNFSSSPRKHPYTDFALFHIKYDPCLNCQIKKQKQKQKQNENQRSPL